MLDGNLIADLGAIFAVLSGGGFYLASRHSRIALGPAPRKAALLVAVSLAIASWPMLGRALDPLAATFAWMTLLMAATTLVPFLPLLGRGRG